MIRALIIVALAAALGSCAPLHQVKAPTNAAEAVVAAQAAVDEVNVLLAATANVIAQNVKDGVMTKPEAAALLDKLEAYARQVDDVRALVKAGSPLAADRAQLVQRLVVALHREVAARARRTP